MSVNKNSNIPFLLFNVFSRMLIPFVAVVYTSLREVILSPQAGSSLDSWITSFFTLCLFWLMQISILKDSPTHYRRRDLWFLGMIWVALAAISQWGAFTYVYHVPLDHVINSYSFLKLEPWPYMLVSLFIAPRFCAIYARDLSL